MNIDQLSKHIRDPDCCNQTKIGALKADLVSFS